LGVFPEVRVALGEGWLVAAYAVFGRLDADDGFRGCEGVGVAISSGVLGEAVIVVCCVANATFVFEQFHDCSGC
jgi:hypothetical protein